MTTWLLNSAVIAAEGWGTYRYEPTTWAELRDVLRLCEVVSRIGYEQTAEEIGRRTGVRPALSRETSLMQPGDVAYVVRLQYRVQDPRTKGAPQAPNWELGRLRRLS